MGRRWLAVATAVAMSLGGLSDCHTPVRPGPCTAPATESGLLRRLAADVALRPATWRLAATAVTELPQGRYCDMVPVPNGQRRAHQVSAGTDATLPRSASPGSLAALYDTIAPTAARLGWIPQGFVDQPQPATFAVATFAVSFCRPIDAAGGTVGVTLSVLVGGTPTAASAAGGTPLRITLTTDLAQPDCRAAPPADLVGDPVPATRTTPALVGRYMVAMAAADDGPTVVTSPVLAGARIYLADGPADATSSATVYALDAATGRGLWRASVFGAVHAALTVTAGTVYLTTTVGTVIAIDAATGRTRWTALIAADQELDGRGRTGIGPAVIVNSNHATAYVIGADTDGPDAYLYALDTATGHLRWRTTIDTGTTPAAAPGGSDAVRLSAPAVSDTMVAVTTGDGTVHAFDATTGTLRWHTGAAAASVPLIHDGYVYVITRHLTLTALDAAIGQPRWTTAYRPPHDAFAERSFYPLPAPVAVAGAVIVTAGLPYAVRPDTGTVRWARDTDPLADPNPVGPDTTGTATPLLIDDDALLYGIDPTTGTAHDYALFGSQSQLGSTATDGGIAARLVLSDASPSPSPDTDLVVINLHT